MNIWETSEFKSGYSEGYGMGHMQGQQFAYCRLRDVLTDIQCADSERILKEMWGYMDLIQVQDMKEKWKKEYKH